MHLDLRSQLDYAQMPGLNPFDCPLPVDEAARELLFCFKLDQEQAQRIDPQADRFLGELVFAGRGTNGQGDFCLSAGMYLFDQQRRALGREECIALAIEQQKDGLWERLRPENRLYIRRLFEDGSPVTQLLRPYTS